MLPNWRVSKIQVGTMKTLYVVSTGCTGRIKLASFLSEREAYNLANALDGIVDEVPMFKTYREARQADSDIEYEIHRTRGAE